MSQNDKKKLINLANRIPERRRLPSKDPGYSPGNLFRIISVALILLEKIAKHAKQLQVLNEK